MNRTSSYPASMQRRRVAKAQTIAAAVPQSQNGTALRVLTLATLAGAAATALLLLSGCNNGPKEFGKINGQIVTQDEYLRQLERQMVVVQGGQPTNAERVVLDQLVSNRVIMTEASKNGVLPTDDDVKNMFKVQQDLFAQQFPGKDYATAMKEQGTTPEQIQSDLRVQLAETALYAKLLKLNESEVRQTYDKYQTAFGLPARVQLRLVVAPQKSPDFPKIQQAFSAKKPFEDIAKDFNPLPMRATGGLLPQALPIAQLPPAWQAKVAQTADGAFFGPVDFQQQGVKAWVKVEKKLPEYKIPFEQAAPLVRRQLVQQKLTDPANSALRNDILQKKMQATFTAQDKSYETVWNAVKEAATKAGVGQSQPTMAPGGTTPVAIPGAK